MTSVSFVRYFLAGVTLTNSVPHFIVALTRRRNITPFGPDSSPSVNLLWGALNFVAGYLLIRSADRKAGPQEHKDAWQLPYEAGCMFWAAFGVWYASYSERKRKAEPGKS